MLVLTGHLGSPREEGPEREAQSPVEQSVEPGDQGRLLPLWGLGFPLVPREVWVTTSF